MAHFRPGSQTPELLAERRVLARRLLEQGLTRAQVCAQLSCSPSFVRKVAAELRAEGSTGSPPDPAP
ncbi:MAG TPA: helix-turn-helix domain-containing protein [Chloroflexota bacterium]